MPVCTQISDFIPLVKLWLSERRIDTAGLLVEFQKYLHVYNEWRHYVLLFTEVLHTQTRMLMGMHTQTHTHLNMLRSVTVNQVLISGCSLPEVLIYDLAPSSGRPATCQLMECEPVFNATTGNKLNELAPV